MDNELLLDVAMTLVVCLFVCVGCEWVNGQIRVSCD